MSITAVAEPAALTRSDRCDRCGAQAYVRAVLHSGGALQFCAHHARAVEDALRPQAALWQDETDRLPAGACRARHADGPDPRGGPALRHAAPTQSR